MKIYGNKELLRTVSKMSRNGRIPSAILIYGEKGLGKKTAAKYIASLLLCESSSPPCGHCRSCILFSENSNPDLIYAVKSGVKGGFSVEEVRRINADAFISPNNSPNKVYLFTDADNIGIPSQNALLKLIEEPPEFSYFIFTAESKNVFLPTILSRVTSLGASKCTSEECIEALAGMGFDKEKAKYAESCFGGNIGLCADFLNGGEQAVIYNLTKRLTDCIINSDEYSFLKNISEIENDRTAAKSILSMLDRQFRDAVMLRLNGKELIGCYKDNALTLSKKLSYKNADKIHGALYSASSKIDGNVPVKLVLTSLCGEIFSCFEAIS